MTPPVIAGAVQEYVNPPGTPEGVKVNSAPDSTEVTWSAITGGISLMMTGAVTELEQDPMVTVYSTVTVPAVIPVNTPPEVMLAFPVPAITDHIPPAVASVNAGVVEPAQTIAAPPAIEATEGNVLTVRVAVEVFEHVPLVTV